jgi:hypothetical protein
VPLGADLARCDSNTNNLILLFNISMQHITVSSSVDATLIPTVEYCCST